MTTPDDLRLDPPPDRPAPAEEEAPSHPAVRLAQQLLDPRGLQALMLSGGGLLAIGLVIWLAVKGVFNNPVVAATGLGGVNLALLGAGVWMAAKTRYQLAGRATALLACVLLPLNLWFYDAQGLLTLANGGNLWIPALMCCLIYGGVARLLKDSLFVYAFTAGVAMMGLLFLADGDVDRFFEVLAPSTLLVALGVGCIHVERLFSVKAANEADRAFTRDDFGRAFFRAGHGLLASGLGVLLAGRLAGRFYEAVFIRYDWFVQPDVTTMVNVKLAAIGLALAGTYAYGYSCFATNGSRRYTAFAALTLAWSAAIGLELLGVGLNGTLFALSLAGLAAIAAGKFSEQTAVGNGGRFAVGLAGAAGAFMASNRLLGGDADWGLLFLLAGQIAVAVAGAVLTPPAEGRRGLFVVAGLQLLIAGLTLNSLSVLTFGQRVEIGATVVGLGFLLTGLADWRREVRGAVREEGDRLVDGSLWIGSLLAVVPMTLGLLGTRLGGSDHGWWIAVHEMGVLAIGLSLAGTGVLCRLRALTLAGVGALGIYLLSLVTLLHVPDQLQSVAVYLMAGGGVLFSGAVLLSVYRDRLLALPQRMREGEGVFAVLKWR